MKFKTPCFVRVEDAEERKRLLTWLQDIGYSLYQSARELSYPIVCCNMIDDEPGNVYGEYEEELVEASHACDCGTDIELFKALAAMNDENDREQWFVCIKQPAIWRFCLPKEGDMVPHNTANAQFIDCENFRKATAEEIVEHFKNRQQ